MNKINLDKLKKNGFEKKETRSFYISYDEYCKGNEQLEIVVTVEYKRNDKLELVQSSNFTEIGILGCYTRLPYSSTRYALTLTKILKL